MKKPLFKVDFNEMVEKNVVLLSRSDEKKAHDGRLVHLQEGLEIDVFEEDWLESGTADNLIASGVVTLTPSHSWSKDVKWSCQIDLDGIKHQSDAGAAKIKG